MLGFQSERQNQTLPDNNADNNRAAGATIDHTDMRGSKPQ
jgi:hypothetical protein